MPPLQSFLADRGPFCLRAAKIANHSELQTTIETRLCGPSHGNYASLIRPFRN
jgi:hypothetical protein